MFDRRIFNPPHLPGPLLHRQSANGSAGLGGHAQRLLATRLVRQNIISLAGLVGRPVLNQRGEEVGKVVDLVARVHGDDAYPALTGMILRIGRRRTFIDASAIDRVERRSVTLRTARLDLRDFQRRESEVLLARDILDHQLVDTDEVQVIRAADLYLAQVGEQVRLVGVDVGLHSLIRRSDRVTIPAAGHFVADDSPKELLEAIRELLG